MNSEEIRKYYLENDCDSPEMESALWLKEIAYQLAMMNERNAQDSQTEFRLPRPFEGAKP